MSEQLLQKLAEQANISQDELQKKIQEKMKSLGNLISEEGAIHIIANELGVALHTTPQTEMTIQDLTPQLKSASFLAKVVRKYDVRTFGEGGKVGNLYVGDATGFTRLTFWNDKTKYLEGIQEGDVLLIQNAYTKENNDRLEVHMGNSAHCIVNPEGRTVTLKERENVPTPAEKKLNEITKEDTMVSITATVVQLYDPRFFESCPVCNKRLREEDGAYVCPEHGPQTPDYNYVMNIYVDDGSDNLRAALWKEQVQKIFGKTHEQLLTIKTDTAQLEDLKNDCLGKIITARARVKYNEQYNQRELVLYDVQLPSSSDSPVAETSSSQTQKTPSQEQTTKDEPKKAETPSATVDEELFSDDDDLLSIDDLDEEL